MNSVLEQVKTEFLKNGALPGSSSLRSMLEGLSGPEALLCLRLLRISERTPDLHDFETRELLRRRNQNLLKSRFTDLREAPSRRSLGARS